MMPTRIFFIILGLVLCAACQGTNEAAQTKTSVLTPSFSDQFGVWSSDGSQIAFTSNRTGDPEIYTANVDGSCLTQLTDTPGRDAHPFWAPDGRTIVFQSPRHEGDTRLFTMKIDGSNQKELFHWQGFCGVPVYAPDGEQIVLMCRPPKASPESDPPPWRIYLVNSDGTQLKQISHGPGDDQVANWSQDGQAIIFHSDRSGDNQIYRYNLATEMTSQVTEGPGENRNASYSPDGKSLLFLSTREQSQKDVYISGVSGDNAVRLTTFGIKYGAPYFSPKGDKVLIPLNPPEGQRIGIMNADGSGLRELKFTACE